MLTLWQKSLALNKYDERQLFELALKTFHHQYENVPIYKDFVNLSNYNIDNIQCIDQIPFLPISFYKSHQISQKDVSDFPLIFESSGTTGMVSSKHYVAAPQIYIESFLNTFQLFYGEPSQYIFACLLPSYLERKHSSLVYMCDYLIKNSGHQESGFFLNDFESLAQLLTSKNRNKKVFLIGVTFGLLDFAERFKLDLSNCIIMETGGMKGRREEQTRQDIHQYLCERWNVSKIHSEYGMTELLSQGYSQGNGIFATPPYMKVLVRDPNDPKNATSYGNGLLNIIDLANQYSCSFIATDDVGKINKDGTFEVLGRNDHSILRGCSLLAI